MTGLLRSGFDRIPWRKAIPVLGCVFIFGAGWGFYFGFFALLGSVFSALFSLFENSDKMVPFWGALMVSETLALIGILGLFALFSPLGKLFAKLGIRPFRKIDWAVWLVGCVICLGGSGALTGCWQMFMDIFKIPYAEKQDIVLMLGTAGPWGTLLIFLSTCLIVPMFEEVLFRRALFAVFRPWGTIPAVLLASAIFASLHFFLLGMPGLFWMGICFQLAYLWSRNLAIPIVMHMTINFLALLGALFLPEL